MPQTLELVTFRLMPGREESFLPANLVVNTWLARQPGFVGRQLARKDNGEWIDSVLWQSHEEALAAAGKLVAEIGTCEAMAAIDPASISMSHATIALAHMG